MNVTGTLINYYFHCKRQCFLAGNRMNFEDDSELVKIGRALHDTRLEGEGTELQIDHVKIDKIKGAYLIEYKKSNSDLKAAQWQVYYYLWVLKQKGLIKKGKLICFEKKQKAPKTLELELTPDVEKKLLEVVEAIKGLVASEVPPEALKSARCKNCAYEAYCKL